MKKILQNKSAYSSIALVLVLVGEGVALAGIRGHVDCWLLWVAVVLLLIVALLFVGRLSGHKFVPRSVIMTKLLANAIAPRSLGVTYLFFFVVHIGWLTNAAMSLFMPTDSLCGNRTLYYYSQDTSKAIPDEERLREVDKSQLPLENLLSQALEKLDK